MKQLIISSPTLNDMILRGSYIGKVFIGLPIAELAGRFGIVTLRVANSPPMAGAEVVKASPPLPIL